MAADSASLSITNPTVFESRPDIKLYGSGAVMLNISSGSITTSWTISAINEYIEIDSELMNCFKDTVLKNDTVKGAEFPVLKPGACSNIFLPSDKNRAKKNEKFVDRIVILM